MVRKSSGGHKAARKSGEHEAVSLSGDRQPADVSRARRPIDALGDRKATDLSRLKPPRGSRHRKVRVGRGIGSKLGKTAGAGNKGQKSRTGFSRRRGFEGGQMPLHRRIPKRGFRNPFGRSYSVVNVEQLNAFPAGETVTPEALRAHGFVRSAGDPIKILGDGELKTKLTVHAHAFSESAKQKIAAAGGSAEVVA